MLIFYHRHVGIQGTWINVMNASITRRLTPIISLQHEGWDTNVQAPSILTEAGIHVALKSDHPVTNAVSFNMSTIDSKCLI